MLKKIKQRILSYLDLLNMKPEAVARISRGKLDKSGTEKTTPLRFHILLFFLTFYTTTVSGIYLSGISDDAGIIDNLIAGLPYSAALMLILFSHEMGHYLAARYYKVKSTLPYFIPFLPFPWGFGTMGAVIKIKAKIPDRRILFYIGIMGPLAGFIVSIVVFIIGLHFSEVKPVNMPRFGMALFFYGDSILTSSLIKVFVGKIPAGSDIFLSPMGFAGWIGFLITTINLMPFGQLDGAHILYALIGEKQRIVGWIAFACLIGFAFIYPGWILWILIILLFLMIGHPPIEKGPALNIREKFLGWLCIVIFVITFIPMPIDLIVAEGKEISKGEVYPVESDSSKGHLEPSGILILNNQLLMISDNPENNTIYKLTKKEKKYRADSFLNIIRPDNLSLKYPLDLEGMTYYKGRFHFIDERNRLIYRAENNTTEILNHSINDYNRKHEINFSNNENSGFEGIAVDPDKKIFFVANERDRAIVYFLKIVNGTLKAFDHIDVEKLSGDKEFDLSDLYFEKNSLYLLYRKGRQIHKIDPVKKEIIDVLTYEAITRGFYKSMWGWGFAEGLFLTSDKIYLLLDSNGEKMIGKSYGENGAVVIFKRPEGF